MFKQSQVFCTKKWGTFGTTFHKSPFLMSCDLDSLIEDDLVIKLHQPPKQSVTIVFGGVGLLLRMERGAKDGKSKASVAEMHEDSNRNAWGEDVRLSASMRHELYKTIINYNMEASVCWTVALIFASISSPIETYTLQGTNSYPTTPEKEHHRLKRAGRYGILC